MDLHEALERHEVDAAAAGPLAALLEALAREPDPHTTVPAEGTVDVHVADSLAALAVPELRTARAIADLGAGAGFPG
ncbi:MAG: rRNA (guanine527-N7)-methyltransferase, partial [Thermoleophilaceae bacterium]|nr:rRNA (guanine527-N7)-methyltransferase [Thermoleophilaceae bacterium]